MIYVILQGDGMADYSQLKISNRTPLEAADTPNMDLIASGGTIGLIDTIPPGLPAGSSVGNMSLMGIDPACHFTGRAPLEAKGLGLNLDDEDLIFRCNLVRLEDSQSGQIMADYSADHIESSDSNSLIELVNKEIDSPEFQFYPGLSYRNLLVWRGGRNKVNWENIQLTPPHDIAGEMIDKYRPGGEGAELLRSIQDRGSRVVTGSEKANAIWLWGAGIKPQIPTFQSRYGLTGSVISAVDLVKGLGAYSGLEPIAVPGATGFVDTNYQGKVEAAIDNLDDESLVFLHIEAPDEASHMGDLDLKIEAIERIDRFVLDPLIDFLEQEEDGRILLVTDHITSVESKSHEMGAVPFAIADFPLAANPVLVRFCETNGYRGERITSGKDLLDLFIAKDDVKNEPVSSLF